MGEFSGTSQVILRQLLGSFIIHDVIAENGSILPVAETWWTLLVSRI